ncbi:MAG: 2-amino-4-hydroxy-6-hydroxymethyldihydropteridine diphosphokinase [Candidatus Marinimicrobia bacterium]|nr:2-amino-4-hydroxy-6-hydroxymethyldihydropteridine diphosphokinase [Candidatus Neomarinimicrobiota bacterium]
MPWLSIPAISDPFAVLDHIQNIEERFLRKRDPRRPKGPRTLDIDILFYGDRTIRSEKLTIPHLLFYERKFILLPMAEINVNYTVPGTSMTIADYIQRCPDRSKLEKNMTGPAYYIAIEGVIGVGKTRSRQDHFTAAEQPSDTGKV